MGVDKKNVQDQSKNPAQKNAKPEQDPSQFRGDKDRDPNKNPINKDKIERDQNR